MWRKFWLESRWRFLIGLALVAGISAVDVAQADLVMPRLGLKRGQFNEFVWKMYFTRVSLGWIVATLLLTAGGLCREQASGASLFSLSLPVSRARWLLVRTAVALGESLALAFVPALVIPAAAAMAGHSYSPWHAAQFSLLMFLTGLAAFGVGVLGSSLMQGDYAPVLLGVGYVLAAGVAANAVFGPGQYADYVTGRQFVDTQWHLTLGWPWLAAVGNAVAGAAFIAIALGRLERRDF